jgi:hypothetical protein
MRRIVLPFVGKGTPDDPRRVDLPTYSLVAESADGLSAVVDVPDDDFPQDAAWDNLPQRVSLQNAGDVSRLPISSLHDWHAHLDARYQEHAGRFRPTPTVGR